MSVDKNQLYNAVMNNKHQICEVLLNLGGDPNMQVPGYTTNGRESRTLTYMAVVYRQVQPKILEILCKHGGHISDFAVMSMMDAYQHIKNTADRDRLSDIDAAKIAIMAKYKANLDIQDLESKGMYKLPDCIVLAINGIRNVISANGSLDKADMMTGFDVER